MSLAKWFKRKPTTRGRVVQTSNLLGDARSPQELVETARAMWLAADAAAGMKFARAATAAAPKQPEAFYVLGLCLERVGQHAEAVSAYARALELDARHGAARGRHEALSRAITPPPARQIPTPVRSWHCSLPLGVLARIQQALHTYSYRGLEMLKNPFDMALYPRLLWETKPRTIIEIGSKSGGSALWMADLLGNFSIKGHVFSVDVVPVRTVRHPRVKFLEGSGRDLGSVFNPNLLERLPRPWLVIEDADHEYETSISVLKFFHPWLRQGEYIVIEDGIISDLSQMPDCNSGPHRALKEFLHSHREDYEIDGAYCDFFGYNVTWATNGWLRKTTPGLMRQKRSTAQADVERLLAAGQAKNALMVISDLKATRVTARDLDFLRARCFLQLGQPRSAIEAAKEELRHFPDNLNARQLLNELGAQHAAKATLGDAEFRELFSVLCSYTMVGEARLWSLFSLAKEVCAEDLPGNFVECGVAGGGSSALLAAVIARHSKRPRKLFAFDSFEGMPQPTAFDRHGGQSPEEHGWSTGTCAAPEDSLREVCAKLGVERLVEPVKGLFANTLPAHRGRIGAIALLHMDGDWHESTRDILQNLFGQVVAGARIQVDDYGYWEGCRQAVTEYQAQHALRWTIREIDGTGVWFVK